MATKSAAVGRSLGLATVLASAVLGSGCATTYYHSYKSQADFYGDKLDCEQRAWSMYPNAPVSVGGGYQAPSQTNCTGYGNQVNCTTTPGAYTPPAQVDGNAFARVNAFHSCMLSKGYTTK